MTSVQRDAWERGATLTHGPAFCAAGGTDAGVQRDVNEDRFHVDLARGLFAVIDGVGGQAAGGKAADVALSMLRGRLERETGRITDRVAEAITIANNEIHRLAATRAEWDGMACVLTVALVTNDTVTVGHVGDTRLYKIREDRIQKVTRDHSPVGEREDAQELSELQAMRHPRRNEVYRDVGSEPHDSADPDFIDVGEVPFEPDAALLLCTDGLTDLLDSASIAQTVRRLAGNPDAVVRALIDAANAAGGKDNVTIVYVEGERFASSQAGLASSSGPADAAPAAPTPRRAQALRLALISLIAVASVLAYEPTRSWILRSLPSPSVLRFSASTNALVVQPNGSIAAALENAVSGSVIIVEPGEYREPITLKDGVRLVSRVSRAATIRLPATLSDAEPVPAMVARNLSRAEVVGFSISGDSATPLPVGILVQDSEISIVDVEITGAATAAVQFSGAGSSVLLGSEIHDNPGAAIVIRDRASPRIAHNSFMRNATSERVTSTLIADVGTAPRFFRNVFVGLSPDAFAAVHHAARAALKDNWFMTAPDVRPSRATPRPSGSAR